MKKISLQVDFWGMLILADLADLRHSVGVSVVFTLFAGYILYKIVTLPKEI